MKTLHDWFRHIVHNDVKVMAIGGSDPGGGAGIQQDIRTVTVLGGYGSGIPTALTVQNSLGVEDVSPVDSLYLERQLENCLSDIQFDAIKIGMILTKENVEAISKVLTRYAQGIPVVLDPVLSSKNEKALLKEEALKVFFDKILPVVTVITPNIPEAKRLLGDEDDQTIDQEELGKRLFKLIDGLTQRDIAVIIKGGHGTEGEKVKDVLVDRDGKVAIYGQRIATTHSHGTGCAYASSLATFLGAHVSLRDAMRLAREFIEISLRESSSLGAGIGPVNTLTILKRAYEREIVIGALKDACSRLESHPKAGLLCPEIQINLGYALSAASQKHDIAAFPGRIVRIGTQLTRVREPEFGASSHVANIILTAMRFDPSIRSAMDIKMSDQFLEKANRVGLKVAFFSRKDEPKNIKEIEGSSLSWGVKTAIEANQGLVPDLIWDDGDIGKEPAIRVLGKDPLDVVKKALSLIEG
ncbi:bifunctional hydroxymethylpyrimidine kinase/phosphomethylpyrimidine kinase [Dissulfuribacter thermophilus]|nr:bifunctional hydroxymethylpyrimidine kinase/phosphomethylpyrimidine kinase [Dissulfuribacter thermophilus]